MHIYLEGISSHTFHHELSGCTVPDSCEVAEHDIIGGVAHIKSLVPRLHILNHQLGRDKPCSEVSLDLNYTHNRCIGRGDLSCELIQREGVIARELAPVDGRKRVAPGLAGEGRIGEEVCLCAHGRGGDVSWHCEG